MAGTLNYSAAGISFVVVILSIVGLVSPWYSTIPNNEDFGEWMACGPGSRSCIDTTCNYKTPPTSDPPDRCRTNCPTGTEIDGNRNCPNTTADPSPLWKKSWCDCRSDCGDMAVQRSMGLRTDGVYLGSGCRMGLSTIVYLRTTVEKAEAPQVTTAETSTDNWDTTQLDAYQALINKLPSGDAKDKAQETHDEYSSQISRQKSAFSFLIIGSVAAVANIAVHAMMSDGNLPLITSVVVFVCLLIACVVYTTSYTMDEKEYVDYGMGSGYICAVVAAVASIAGMVLAYLAGSMTDENAISIGMPRTDVPEDKPSADVPEDKPSGSFEHGGKTVVV